MKFLLLILLFIFYSEKTNAACKCMCVDGEMEPICTSALDIPLPCIGTSQGWRKEESFKKYY